MMNPQLLLLLCGLLAALSIVVLRHRIVRALSFLSAWDVPGLTPLGPLPSATLGCSVAAPRCRVSGGGDAVAVPPPLDSYGERQPVPWYSFALKSARPRTESSRRPQRGFHSAPLVGAPFTCTVGHLQGVVVFAPHVLPLHIP